MTKESGTKKENGAELVTTKLSPANPTAQTKGFTMQSTSLSLTLPFGFRFKMNTTNSWLIAGIISAYAIVELSHNWIIYISGGFTP